MEKLRNKTVNYKETRVKLKENPVKLGKLGKLGKTRRNYGKKTVKSTKSNRETRLTPSPVLKK